ncbi:bifunctional DNA primase/polymerase [Streptomyces bungoensis]|uniref:bifunctional DNA primase/polymerase n=1 Tax=Streptomyces bungoensis TaxID=285568 RepID=UPI00099E2021|nr:bifunctional DNA primase/polymerase [Streptomyces bungoensis]
MATTDRQATTLALAHALSAAERGLAVIPLSRTKLPALRSPHRDDPAPAGPPCHGACGRPGHGVYDASTDPARIRELFAAAPWATGYGIACGLSPHHLIGVDLDTKSGTDSPAALRELALRHLFTIPETVVVLTPSGGRHLWLTGPPDVVVPNSASRLAPGIDIRGAGGYLVGPGSRTDHGVYATAPGTAHLPPAACPPALLRLLLPPPPSAHPAPPPHGEHGRGLVHFVLTAHEGQRNTRLFWAACRAYENGIGPALLTPLVEAARSTGLTEHEARATIASAARMTGTRPSGGRRNRNGPPPTRPVEAPDAEA